MKELLIKITGGIKKRPFEFAFYWLVIFFVLISLSLFMGILEEDQEEESPLSADFSHIIPETPTRVVIEKIGVEVDIRNPESRSIEILNNELNEGAVRYPGSGLAGSENNVFIFGHSSHLPVVLNRNYKAFNDLEDLVTGDLIKVQSENTEFVYEVFKVKEADAEDFRVDFGTDKRMLTLSTCNNFGDLDDRFVVEAELVGTRSL